jgi:hypothetical protein
MRVIQLLVRTNIPELNDIVDPPKMWIDTNYPSLTLARSTWPKETYREVEVLSE